MAELRELSVAEAAARIAAGETSAEEYFEAWQAAARIELICSIRWAS